METFLVIFAFVLLWFVCWLGVGWVFDRRRCVVCGLHVSRRDFRAPKLWVPERMGWGPVHRGCVVPSDAAIRQFVDGAR